MLFLSIIPSVFAQLSCVVLSFSLSLSLDLVLYVYVFFDAMQVTPSVQKEYINHIKRASKSFQRETV